MNGNIVFTIAHNRICYFNMKSFSIQAIFTFKEKDKKYITGFNQLLNRNYFFLYFGWDCYEINLKNGKYNSIDFNSTNSSDSIIIDNYLVDSLCNGITIESINSKSILFSNYLEKPTRIFLINERSKSFIALCSYESSYETDLYIYKISNK